MNKIAKRVFDIVFALTFIILFSPIYLLTAIIIVICNPGNPIYKAKRIGLYGKIFTCYKFRSMCVDSGKIHLTTLRNDIRIFPFGRFIRKLKIDEMPQAFNILIGNMSVVGPRPEDKDIAYKIYIGQYKRILCVKPGLTSIASLYDFTHGEKYESEEAYKKEFLPQKLALELYYVEHKNFWCDIKIVFRTAFIVLQMLLGKQDFTKPNELNSAMNMVYFK